MFRIWVLSVGLPVLVLWASGSVSLALVVWVVIGLFLAGRFLGPVSF